MIKNILFMEKLSQYFYVFSKLTTSLILLTIIFIMGYALYNSYQSIDKSNNQVDKKILNFSEDINSNRVKLQDIQNNLNLNQQSIEEIKDSLDVINYESESLNNKKEIKEILNLINNLKKEIDNLATNLENQKVEKVFSSDDKFTKQSLINLIIIKYKNSANIDEELNLLQSMNQSKKNIPVFEKLLTLQTNKFIGLQKLNSNFIEFRNAYVENMYLQKNQGMFMKFISNFVEIKPNNIKIYNNKSLNILAKAQNYLESEDIEKSIETLRLIRDEEQYFSGWLNQASLYIEFVKEIRKIT